MAAVHRYEGTVNQVMGDGIMALFGAPIAHEDHAIRACYAALAMQDVGATVCRRSPADTWRAHPHPGRVEYRGGSGPLDRQRPPYGLYGRRTNDASGRPHGADGHARHDSDHAGTSCGLVEGYVQVTSLGPVPIKGLSAPAGSL